MKSCPVFSDKTAINALIDMNNTLIIDYNKNRLELT